MIDCKKASQTTHAFWDATLCHWAGNSQSFEGPHCLHVQGKAVFLDCLTLKMKAHYLSRHQEVLTERHTITSQKTRIVSNIAESTWNVSRLIRHILLLASNSWAVPVPANLAQYEDVYTNLQSSAQPELYWSFPQQEVTCFESVTHSPHLYHFHAAIKDKQLVVWNITLLECLF